MFSYFASGASAHSQGKPLGEPSGGFTSQPPLPSQEPSRARGKAAEQPAFAEAALPQPPEAMAIRQQLPECEHEVEDEQAAESRGSMYEHSKRLLDLLVAGVALVLLAPLLVLLAAAIRWQDGGASLFWQARVGRGGKLFWCPKLRSMRVDADREIGMLAAFNRHRCGVAFKMVDDPRVTRLGRCLRKYSLDELPQLWCVLLGDMSLVGPRPPLPREVLRYTALQKKRLAIRPGLTCLWQIRGRADLDFERQVELDLEYIRTRSLQLDLRILLATVPAVLSARGAY